MMKDNTIVQQETSAGDYKQTEEIKNSDTTITISPFEAAIQSFIEYLKSADLLLNCKSADLRLSPHFMKFSMKCMRTKKLLMTSSIIC